MPLWGPKEYSYAAFQACTLFEDQTVIGTTSFREVSKL